MNKILNKKQAKSLLHIGAVNGNIGMVKFALDSGDNIDSKFNNLTALHLACGSKNIEIVEYLINRGSSINVYKNDKSMLTPLHFAVNTGDLDLVELLVQNGAKIETTDNRISPTCVAYANNFLDIAAYLEYHSSIKMVESDPIIENKEGMRKKSYSDLIDAIKPRLKRFFSLKRNKSSSCSVIDSASEISTPSISHSI